MAGGVLPWVTGCPTCSRARATFLAVDRKVRGWYGPYAPVALQRRARAKAKYVAVLDAHAGGHL